MCIIIDNCVISKVFVENKKQLKYIKHIITSNINVMVYGGELRREYIKNDKIKRLLVMLDRSGRTRLFRDDKVDEETKRIRRSKVCKSNDCHIIALARVSGARLLCSNDKDLHADFKNAAIVNNPRGNVYQNENHMHLVNTNCIKCKQG